MDHVWLKQDEVIINDFSEIVLCEVCPCDTVAPFLCLCPNMGNRLCLEFPFGVMSLYYIPENNDYEGEITTCAPWMVKTIARVYCLNTEFGLFPYLSITAHGVGGILNFPGPSIPGEVGYSANVRIPFNIAEHCNPNLDIGFISEGQDRRYYRLYDIYPTVCPETPELFECRPFPSRPEALLIYGQELLYFYYDGSASNGDFSGYYVIGINGRVLYPTSSISTCRYANCGISTFRPSWSLDIPVVNEFVNLGNANFTWIGNEDSENGLNLLFTGASVPIYRAVGAEYTLVSPGDTSIFMYGTCDGDLTCHTLPYPENVTITLHSDCPIFDGLTFTAALCLAGGTPDGITASIPFFKVYDGVGSEDDLYMFIIFENGGLGGTPTDEYIIFYDFTTAPQLGFNPSGQGVIEQGTFECSPFDFESETKDIAGSISGVVPIDYSLFDICGFVINLSVSITPA